MHLHQLMASFQQDAAIQGSRQQLLIGPRQRSAPGTGCGYRPGQCWWRLDRCMPKPYQHHGGYCSTNDFRILHSTLHTTPAYIPQTLWCKWAWTFSTLPSRDALNVASHLPSFTMPRRPVKPEDRQRVARACDPCKASKKRCDGNQPCDACGKKGNIESCHYTRGRRRHPLPRRTSFLSQNARLSHLNPSGSGSTPGASVLSPLSSWEVHGHSVASPGSAASDENDADGHDGSELGFDETQNSSNEGMDQPSLMLSSVNGENGKPT